MAFVVLGLGSNSAYAGMEPMRILRMVCAELGALLVGMCCSSVYRSRPMYVEAQPPFCNMAVCGEYAGTARELLHAVQRMEARFGRDRSKEIRNGPRPLDIDIELFGTERIAEPDLQVPHPRIAERAFVLVPLLEILPDSFGCAQKEAYSALLDALHATEADIELLVPADELMQAQATLK